MSDPSMPAPRPVRANPETSIGRLHVESERALASTREFESRSFVVEGFATEQAKLSSQWLSGDAQTGESTQRLHIPAGWRAPIGHFDQDVELFVLSGRMRQGGFSMRALSYAYLPAGMPVGPWDAEEDTIVLWMPDARPQYVTADYASLEPRPENALYHRAAQDHPRMAHYKPAVDLNAMSWESTTFLPAGSARKSLYTDPKTGRATWILGLVPMWIEGNFYAGHPTTEEAYLIRGDILGHWSMQDDPFERRYAKMGPDGYYWRPAHVPHGPFWTESGALLLFRTKDRLDCNWVLHDEDIAQRHYLQAQTLRSPDEGERR